MPGQTAGVVLESLRDPGRHAGADGKQINVHLIRSPRKFLQEQVDGIVEVGAVFNVASLPARVSPTVTELLRCKPAMMLRTGSTGIAVFALRLAGKDVESDI